MFNVGDTVKIIHNDDIGAVVGVEALGTITRYKVLVNGIVRDFFEDQLNVFVVEHFFEDSSSKEVNALLTASLLLEPNAESLYSLNSAKIDYIPYQFRPVLKIIKSDASRILIADGVGVGKTIEAGIILKELEARFDIKSVLVICPRPLITEKKWQNELKRFGERFVHLDGKQLRYCINEAFLDDGEWPTEYQKCIVPYSLFDEGLLYGTADNGKTKLKSKCLSDLKPFPKFDLVIIDEAHHIKNTNTFGYKVAQKFCENAESIILLTATPIQLGDQDLFVLLNLIRPDLVLDYESFKHMSEPNPFINEAVKLIRSNNVNWKAEALEKMKKAGETNWGKAMLKPDPIYQEAIQALESNDISQERRVELITEVEKLHTFAHIINRTRRRDIGNFTLRKPETLKVSFTEEQSELYDRLMEMQARILMQLHGERNIRFMMTTIMRQAASCIHGLRPFLQTILTRRFDELEVFDGGIEDDLDYVQALFNGLSLTAIKKGVNEILELSANISNTDYKLEALINTIQGKQKMDNNKVMVFSSFRHTLNYLFNNLSTKGFKVGVVHGGVKDEERVKLRERFMLEKTFDEAIDVLLFSEVGCEGLDYQFCDCMINYDLPWNPQAIEQRIGRIDRNGQKSESVTIINIITEGTIDCDIYDRCLSRIGVFNASIGDSEEILGDITKEIYDICEKYILNPEERRAKLQQLNDNKIRFIQEQQRMEDEKQAFFSLDMSEELFKKELDNATNIHLSADAVYKLVETYLQKRLGDGTRYILGEEKIKTLRMNAENRKILLDDFKRLPLQVNYVYRDWEAYLNDTVPFEKITFDGECAADHSDVVFISAAHPLVKQALMLFEKTPVFVSLKVETKSIEKGIYPFLIYEWTYKGVKPDNKLKVITDKTISDDIFLQAVYNSHNGGMDASSIDQIGLEEKHYKMWQFAKEEYLEVARKTVGFKKSSLSSSFSAIQKTIEDRLINETNPQIILMKNSELERKKNNFKQKMDELDKQIIRSDILTRKLVVGILQVEN